MKNMIYTLVVSRFEDIFHSYYAQEVIRGASSASSRLKVDLLIHLTERQRHDDWFTSPALNQKLSHGVVFGDIDRDRASLDKLIRSGIPYVVLNNSFSEPLNCIGVDNYGATLRLMRYLFRMGHRRVATICGDLNTEAGRDRLRGYQDALAGEKLSYDGNYVKKGEFLRTPARIVAEQLLKLKKRPTAIFAASDIMALEVIDVAKNIGIKVPEELSVVGFDDNPINVYSPIPLTTVRQPIAEMARLGLEILHRIAQGKELLPVKKKLETDLIERASCAPPEKVKV